MDGNNPSSSSGSYGKWNVSSSATLPSSSAGVLASSSATSAAATLAVGSMTLGSTSQHQSAQSKNIDDFKYDYVFITIFYKLRCFEAEFNK